MSLFSKILETSGFLFIIFLFTWIITGLTLTNSIIPLIFGILLLLDILLIICLGLYSIWN